MRKVGSQLKGALLAELYRYSLYSPLCGWHMERGSKEKDKCGVKGETKARNEGDRSKNENVA